MKWIIFEILFHNWHLFESRKSTFARLQTHIMNMSSVVFKNTVASPITDTKLFGADIAVLPKKTLIHEVYTTVTVRPYYKMEEFNKVVHLEFALALAL